MPLIWNFNCCVFFFFAKTKTINSFVQKQFFFFKFGAKLQRSNAQLFYRRQQSTGDSKRIQARVPVTAKYRWQQTNTILRTLIQCGFSCPYEHSELLIVGDGWYTKFIFSRSACPGTRQYYPIGACTRALNLVCGGTCSLITFEVVPAAPYVISPTVLDLLNLVVGLGNCLYY